MAIGVVVFFSPVNRWLLTPGTGARHRSGGIRWILPALLAPPALFLLAWLVANSQGGDFDVAALEGGAVGIGRVVLASFVVHFLFGGPLGEEIGWRGCLLPRLLRAHGPLVASLALALIWALWHAPIDLTSGFLVQGPAAVLVRIVWTMPLAIPFIWFHLGSGADLLVALVLHTSLNTLSDFGFSGFERSLGLFFLLMTAAAVGVCFTSAMRGAKRPGRAQGEE